MWPTCGEGGAVPAANPFLTPLGELLGQYRVWMVQERGLAPMTVLRYENTARHFLQEQATDDDGVFRPAALTGGGHQRVPAPGVRSSVDGVGQRAGR